MKKKTKFQLYQEQAEQALIQTNSKIDELGNNTSHLFETLNNLQSLFDDIRNIPHEQAIKYAELKQIRQGWKQHAEKIENDHKKLVADCAGTGAAGAGVGVAVAALGPNAAMGFATTFGVASTGTSISTLSGAAATKAALAWLGGGALSAGGGGMAAGNLFLSLLGPVGWTIAGAALISSGILLWKGHSEKNRLEKVFALISKRDTASYYAAIVELNERIVSIKRESAFLTEAVEQVKSFGKDYSLMTVEQQFKLGSYVNLMNAATQLLVNPILGLVPKYTKAKLDRFLAEYPDARIILSSEALQNMAVSLACLLYKIDIDANDTKLLWKSLKRNKKFLSEYGISKRELSLPSILIMPTVDFILQIDYSSVK